MPDDTTTATTTATPDTDTTTTPDDSGQYSTLNPKPDEATTEGQKAEPQKEPEVKAPENYEDFTIPEGMDLDKQAVDAFIPVAKQLNLTQSQAQSLVDLYAGQIAEMQQAQVKAMADQRSAWVEEIRQDSEVGGPDMHKKIGLAISAIDKFAGPDFRQFLHETGLSDHPDMVRTFYRIGKAMDEDTIKSGEAKLPQKTTAEILYPDMGQGG